MSFKQRSLAKSRTWRLINQSVRLVTLTQVFTRITTIITIKSLVWKFQKTQGKTRTLNHWCCSWLRSYLTVSHQSVKTCRNGKCYVWRPNTIKYSLVTKQHLLLSCLIKIWTSTIIWSSTIKFARLDDDKTRLIAFCHFVQYQHIWPPSNVCSCLVAHACVTNEHHALLYWQHFVWRIL